jgi:hypothetical protein
MFCHFGLLIFVILKAWKWIYFSGATGEIQMTYSIVWDKLIG